LRASAAIAAPLPAPPRPAGAWSVREIGVVACILAVSLALDVTGRDSSLYVHPDEARKVEFIQSGTQDFRHPILILQLARTAVFLLQPEGAQAIVETARTVSALAAAAAVLLAYALFRRSLEPPWALIAAAQLAVAPILVVHAHYLKEDVLLTATTLASLVALCHLLEGRRAVAALGIATGLACASHYKGFLLLPTMAAVPVLVPVESIAAYARKIVAALLVAAVVFLIVNYPMLLHPTVAYEGATFEARHALTGHHLVIDGPSQWFSFHLRHSVWPGLTGFFVAAMLPGAILAAVRFRRLAPAARLTIAFGALSYAVVELSPLKPFPGFMRYVLPAVPAMVLCAGLFLQWVHAALRDRSLAWLSTLVALVILAAMAQRSVRLVSAMPNDSRAEAARWLHERSAVPLFELYASGGREDLVSLVQLDLEEARKNGVTHVVASSFQYGRLAFGSRLEGQPDYIYEFHGKYEDLFRHPYVEIPPRYMSFAFSDPTLRIVDIRPRPETRQGGDGTAATR
jgi:hypothetical protein